MPLVRRLLFRCTACQLLLGYAAYQLSLPHHIIALLAVEAYT